MPPLTGTRPRILRKTVRACIGGLFFLVLCARPGHGMKGAGDPVDYSRCLSCHEGVEEMGPDHRFPCSDCHLRPDARGKTLADHEGIVKNPSAPGHVKVFCGKCHQREIARLEKSLHSTMAGIINQTRYLWGGQETAYPPVYGLSGPLKPLPRPGDTPVPDSPAMLVDDFLRRRCLRCHIHSMGTKGRGLYRGAGCAACHVLYNDEGTYEGDDRAVDRSKKGYPARHTFTRRIPVSQCLRCHNHNHVGGDYEGLFEHDYSDTYRSPTVGGRLTGPIYGAWQHRLARDVHRERGLWCIDCHTGKEVMGDGKTYGYQMEVPKRTCAHCHGGLAKAGPDPGIRAVRKGPDGHVFISKAGGAEHPLPLFSPVSPGHRVPAHKRVRCSACHAQWSYQDYGLSVMREDLISDYKWRRLAAQGDPYLQARLKKYAESRETAYPSSADRLSGVEKPGIWSIGWRFRRWEQMPLGVDDRGMYSLLRPLYQYLVSFSDRRGLCVLDSVIPLRGDGTGRGWAFMPCVPHTTAPFGRGCDGCHQNRVAAGLGIDGETTVDTALTIPWPPAVDTMRLLNRDEQRSLMKPTGQWHRERLRALTDD